MTEASNRRRPQRWDEPFGGEALGDDEIKKILALPTFAEVKADQFPSSLPLKDVLANDARIRIFSRGDIVVREGDYGNSVFVIMRGAVRGAADAKAESFLSLRRKIKKRSLWDALAQLWRNARVPERRSAVTALQAPGGADKIVMTINYVGRDRRRIPPITDYEGAERRRLRESGRGSDAQVTNVSNYDQFVATQQTFRLKAPEMFGEIAALARSPRTVTVIADEDHTVLLEMRWQGLRDIRRWSAPFREHIDKLYHERSLTAHLKETPLFSRLDDATLALISDATHFETYGGFEWNHSFKQLKAEQKDTADIIEQEPVIQAEDQYLDGVLLVRSGFARVSRRLDHGEKTVGYLSKNGVFGLPELIAHAKDGGVLKAQYSLRAIGYVDILRVPSRLIEEHILPHLTEADLPAGLVVREAAKDGALAGAASEGELEQPLVDFLVDNRIINGTATMLVNLERCVNCDDCVRACATAHDGNPRFVRHGEKYANLMVSNACMHCIDPVCLIGCPTGAIHRDAESGNVIINDITCIGCATCANSCPYHNIRMVTVRDNNGQLWADSEGMTIQKATKCDLCIDQVGGPACQRACPHDALTRMDMRDTRRLVEWVNR